jgi:hypothetical protein
VQALANPGIQSPAPESIAVAYVELPVGEGKKGKGEEVVNVPHVVRTATKPRTRLRPWELSLSLTLAAISFSFSFHVQSVCDVYLHRKLLMHTSF